jgi:transposase
MTSKPPPTRSGNTNYQRRSRRSPRLVEELQQRRRQAAEMFRAGSRPALVARELGVSRQAACTWHQRWLAEGEAGLRIPDRVGRPAKLSDDQLRSVEAVLLEGAQAHGYRTDLWTLQRVAEVIAQVTGVTYHPGHVWRLLRHMGWSRQKPARRAVERDEARVTHWVTLRSRIAFSTTA